jgi:hypothetical protein
LNVPQFFASIVGMWVDFLGGIFPVLLHLVPGPGSTAADGWIAPETLASTTRGTFTGSAGGMLIRAVPTRKRMDSPASEQSRRRPLRDTDLSDPRSHISPSARSSTASPPPSLNQALRSKSAHWLTSLLQRLPDPKQSPNRVRSQLRLGSAGSPYLRQIDISDVFLSSFSPETGEIYSSASVPPPSDGRFQRKQPGIVQGSIQRLPPAQWLNAALQPTTQDSTTGALHSTADRRSR